MTLDEFWDLIEKSRLGAEDGDEIAENLESALENLPADEIRDFAQHLHDRLNEAYTWDLWGAAYIINGGSSDDGFEYFRGYLIGRGRAFFENALQHPDVLGSDIEPEEAENEAILYAASQTYEKLTGEYPDIQRKQPTEPKGLKWTEEDLPERFPNLWEQFGE